MVALAVGTGSSQAADSAEAGTEAARHALRMFRADAPDAPVGLVVVYASMRYQLQTLIHAIRAETGEAPLVGSTSSGQFSDGELVAPGEGVIVAVLGDQPYHFGIASATGLRERPFPLGQELTREAIQAAGPHRPRHGAVLVLADGLAGDLQNLLNGIYQVAGTGVPVIGGAASADRELDSTFVFRDDQILADGAVAVWIGADRQLPVSVAHGWRSEGLPLLVTRVEGTQVYEIGGRPALEVYKESFPIPGVEPDAPIENWLGFDATRAFGLIEPDGFEVIRGVYVTEDAQVHTFTPLPPYCAVKTMRADADDLLGISDQVMDEAISRAEAVGASPTMLLTFSCAARMDILKGRAVEEAQRLHKAAGGRHTFGFYTYGEFARNTGVSGYHNATIAALAL